MVHDLTAQPTSAPPVLKTAEVTARLATLCVAAARRDVSTDQLTDETSLLEDLDVDSLSLVELVVAIETEWEIELDEGDVEIDRLTRFGSLRDMVVARLLGT